MQLPYLTSNLLVWMDPSERYVNFSGNRKVISVLNRLDGQPIKQLNEGHKPTWFNSLLNGTPGIGFYGDQRISIDLPSVTVSSKPLGITFATQFEAVTGNIAFEVGNKGNSSLIGLGMGFDTGSGLVEPYLFDDNVHGSVLNVNYELDNRVHVWSLLYDLHSLIVRVDGNIISQTPVPGIGPFHFNCLTIGDICYDSPNPIDHFYYSGNIGTLLLYQGDTIHSAAEEYVLASVGL